MNHSEARVCWLACSEFRIVVIRSLKMNSSMKKTCRDSKIPAHWLSHDSHYHSLYRASLYACGYDFNARDGLRITRLFPCSLEREGCGPSYVPYVACICIIADIDPTRKELIIMIHFETLWTRTKALCTCHSVQMGLHGDTIKKNNPC